MKQPLPTPQVFDKTQVSDKTHVLDKAQVPDKVTRSRRLLRVAVVTESYPPEVNGVAHSVARVVDGLRARQHSVQLVRPRQGRQDRPGQPDRYYEVLTQGVPIPVYGALRMGLPSGRLLTQLWSKHRPDLVHIATEGPLGWSALRAALKLKLPVCSEFRTNFAAYSQFYGAAWLHEPITAYLRNFHNRCHSTMVPTDALRRQLALKGFRALSVVARGVDTQLFSPHQRSTALRASWGVQDGDPVALYVGRLAPEKNLGVLLQAFQHLRAQQPRARPVVVGDGPSRKEMEAQCRQAIFAGFRAGDDLAAHYASSDLFLFPSLTETFGNVTLEAMASGLAVVAFNDAAAGQLIDHQTSGLLAPKGDSSVFAQLAKDAADDPAMAQWLGQHARQKALELGWENILLKIEDVYAATIAQVNSPLLPRVWTQVQRG